MLDFPNDICSANSNGSGAFTSCGSFINQAYGDAAGVNVTYKDLINVGTALHWWSAGYNNLIGRQP